MLVYEKHRVGRSGSQLAEDTRSSEEEVTVAVQTLLERGVVTCRGPYKIVDPIPLTTTNQSL